MSDNLALPLKSCHHPQSLLGMGGIVVSILKLDSSVEAWSIAMYTNGKLYTQRSSSTVHGDNYEARPLSGALSCFLCPNGDPQPGKHLAFSLSRDP